MTIEKFGDVIRASINGQTWMVYMSYSDPGIQCSTHDQDIICGPSLIQEGMEVEEKRKVDRSSKFRFQPDPAIHDWSVRADIPQGDYGFYKR